MCCAEFIVKYALFISNLAFSLLGLAVVGLGIGSLVSLKDLQEILPVTAISVSFIVVGVVVFFIAFLACCGAVRESRCMLYTYAIIVTILAAFKIYLAVVVFGNLSNIQGTVDGWIVSSFNNNNLRPAFSVMEASFRCCGTTGANSYTSSQQAIPATCCANPETVTSCTADAAFGGCGTLVGEWFESYRSATGGVLLVVIIVEVVAIIFALFFANAIRNKRRRNY